MPAQPDTRYRACINDCPSACALAVERLDAETIGRVRRARNNAYTAGVICSKAARYAERIHHPDRLTTPLRRVGERPRSQLVGSRRVTMPLAWVAVAVETANGFRPPPSFV